MTADLTALAGRPVIVGGGLAGLMTALELAPTPCVLVTGSALGADCASDLAQGGLEKRARQLLAGGGVDAVQASIAFGAALTVNEVESGEVHLKSSLGEK